MVEETYVSTDEWKVMQMQEWEARRALLETRRALKICIAAMVAAVMIAIAGFILADTTPKAYAADFVAGSAATQAATPTNTVKAQATATNPYPDVTVKKVGRYAWNSIKFVKSKGGYKGIVAGTRYVKVKVNGKTYYKKTKGKFKPNKKVTHQEFLAVLTNLYGEGKVPVGYADVKNANKPITAQYACNKMVEVAKNLGANITWKAKKASLILNRASAANYLYVFATYNPKLMPA